MPSSPFDIIVIGGSAGSLDVIMDILAGLPAGFDTPVVLVVHRLKNTPSVLDELLSKKMNAHKVIEPEDKQSIHKGTVYLAPQNYHLLAGEDHCFVLDYSEPIHYSRPSIDASFESFASIYGKRMLAIVLSGANRDGADGLENVLSKGGVAIVQSPRSALYEVMPQSAIDQNPAAMVIEPGQIVPCILNYNA